MPVKAERLTATCNVSRIVQGESLTLTVELFDEVSGEAFALADLDTAEAKFVGTPVLVGEVLTPVVVTASATAQGDPGRLLITLTDVATAAMLVGDGTSWQLSITLDSGTIRIVQLVDQLDVVASLF